jgi:hypothetical protein
MQIGYNITKATKLQISAKSFHHINTSDTSHFFMKHPSAGGSTSIVVVVGVVMV